jgi:hypothetical protein
MNIYIYIQKKLITLFFDWHEIVVLSWNGGCYKEWLILVIIYIQKKLITLFFDWYEIAVLSWNERCYKEWLILVDDMFLSLLVDVRAPGVVRDAIFIYIKVVSWSAPRLKEVKHSDWMMYHSFSSFNFK